MEKVSHSSQNIHISKKLIFTFVSLVITYSKIILISKLVYGLEAKHFPAPTARHPNEISIISCGLLAFYAHGAPSPSS